jgi:hypothetical protein
MDEKNNNKGFAGFDDLASDVSKDLEQANQAPAPSKSSVAQSNRVDTPQQRIPATNTATTTAPETTDKSSPVYHSSAGSSGGNTAGKWFIGIIVAIVFISWINSSGKQSGNTYKQPTSSTPGSNTVYTPSAPSEVMPPVGTNNVLSSDQIRYCLSEKIRIETIRNSLDNYLKADVNKFNIMVSDFNSRCSQYRYRRGALQSVQREVDANRLTLEFEGRARMGR